MIDVTNEITDIDDVEVSDQERDIALTALFEFNRKNYNACNQQLEKLERSLNNNFKLLHNKAVTDFYESNCQNVDELRKALQFLNSQITNYEGLKAVDKCPLFYNLAVILYHSCKPNSALKLLLKVQPHLDQLEESLVEKSVLLLCELLLNAHRAKDALELIDCMEARLQVSSEMYGEVLEKFNIKIEIFQKRLDYYRKRALFSMQLVHDLTISDDKNLENLFLQSRLLYLQGNNKSHEELIKFIRSPSKDAYFANGTSILKGSNNENLAILALNNIGVIEFSLGHFHLATHSLQQSLSRDIQLVKNIKNTREADSSEALDKKPLLQIASSMHRYSILYNLGVSLLFSGRPRDAFECLLEPLHYQHNNPKLWLRIAECCIMVHQQMKAENKTPIVHEVIGKNAHKKLILNNITPLKYTCDDSQSSYAIPSPSLEFALLCLKIVLNLLPKEELVTEQTELGYGIPLRELSSLRNSALAASAFVCLCIGDCSLALEHAQTLLTQSQVNEAHKMLGHLYCAEALVLMNKISEAVHHLDPDSINGISTIYSNDNNSKTTPPTVWEIKNVQMAKQITTYNLAVTLAIRGDFTKAKMLLQQLKNDERNVFVSMLDLYIELQLGNLDTVKEIIRQNNPQPV